MSVTELIDPKTGRKLEVRCERHSFRTSLPLPCPYPGCQGARYRYRIAEPVEPIVRYIQHPEEFDMDATLTVKYREFEQSIWMAGDKEQQVIGYGWKEVKA